MFIREVKSRVIKNSRGERTIEVEIKTYEGRFTASAPSGKSRGIHEVQPYHRDGIDESVKRFHVFAKKLIHQNIFIKTINDLEPVEKQFLQFEKKYGVMGGNVLYALETALLRAGAADANTTLWKLIHNDVNKGKKIQVPMPVGNCIGGAKHSQLLRGKKPDFQEFLLIPKEKTFSRAITVNLRAYEYAQKLLKSHKRNDENAWMTDKTNEEVLDILRIVAKKFHLRIGLDVAASSFYQKGYYHYKNKKLIRDNVDQRDYMEQLIKKYQVFYVEDPFQEEDFSGFKSLLNRTTKNKHKSLIVGDDLTTTNNERLSRATRAKAINALIVKPNQIGSLIEVKKVVEHCQQHNITMIFSHRSGETMDDALADYCIGFAGQFMKAGIYGRERLIKLKRIIDIEKEINKQQ